MIPLIISSILAAPPPNETFPSLLNAPKSAKVETKTPPKKEYLTPRRNLIVSTQEIDRSIPLYSYPGFVSLKNGQWFGSDNFVNLQKTISISVTFVKPETLTLSLTEAQIEERMAAALEKGALTIDGQAMGTKPPLPLFNIIVLFYPVGEGIVASCQARLFEEVTLARVHFDQSGVFQAITWEQQNLVIGPKEDFQALLISTIDGMVTNFLKRLSNYQQPSPPR